MLTAEDMRGLVAARGGWQPDPRASLSLAAIAAALLGLAFLGLLYRPVAAPRPALLTLSIVHTPTVRHAAGRAAAPTPTQVPVVPLPELEPLPPVGGTQVLPEQVEAAARAVARTDQGGAFLIPAPSELEKALKAPEKPAALQEGEGYHSVYGYSILKSGEGCTKLQEVQVGPVAKATVGFVVSCPGKDRATLADGVEQWAEKRAAANPPP